MALVFISFFLWLNVHTLIIFLYNIIFELKIKFIIFFGYFWFAIIYLILYFIFVYKKKYLKPFETKYNFLGVIIIIIYTIASFLLFINSAVVNNKYPVAIDFIEFLYFV